MDGKRFVLLLAVIVITGLIVVSIKGGINVDNNVPFLDRNRSNSFGISSAQTEKSSYGVSASHPLAVEIGMEVMEKGGNAVDAAVAVAYALSVLQPYASGIGGGGVMLVYPGDERPVKTYHYREVVPLSGKVHRLGIGVPGLVKGMEYVHQKYGQLEMEELLDPAIELAEEGFPIDPVFAERLHINQSRLDTSRLSHFYPNNTPLEEGDRLVQEELAQTLKLIRDQGSDAFYTGEIAQQLAKSISTIELSDLKAYRVRESEPAVGRFDQYEVYATDAPTSGITVIQALQMLDMLKVKEVINTNESEYIHLVSEVMKAALYDRLHNIADPSFFEVDAAELTSLGHTYQLIHQASSESISNLDLRDTPADFEDHQNTTHFVVVDKEGMMVSATHTLSQTFGSGVYVGGFFLNNQLYNFSTNPKSPNYPQAGKSPRTFMAPTILAQDGKPVLGIGSAGGRRIPIVIVQVLLSALYRDDNLQNAINRPRFHVEKNRIYIESREMAKDVEKLDYRIDLSRLNTPFFFGGVQGLYREAEDKLDGGADHRRGGSWQAR